MSDGREVWQCEELIPDTQKNDFLDLEAKKDLMT
jgi:hypothetical protein